MKDTTVEQLQKRLDEVKQSAYQAGEDIAVASAVGAYSKLSTVIARTNNESHQKELLNSRGVFLKSIEDDIKRGRKRFEKSVRPIIFSSGDGERSNPIFLAMPWKPGAIHKWIEAGYQTERTKETYKKRLAFWKMLYRRGKRKTKNKEIDYGLLYDQTIEERFTYRQVFPFLYEWDVGGPSGFYPPLTEGGHYTQTLFSIYKDNEEERRRVLSLYLQSIMNGAKDDSIIRRYKLKSMSE